MSDAKKISVLSSVHPFSCKVVVLGIVCCLIMITQMSIAQERIQRKSALTYEERVNCQKAIEKIYWQYRIWPKENPGSKIPFEKTINQDTLNAQVENIIKQTNALEYYWRESITGEQLQLEIRRMAFSTKKSDMLRDLWNALGNDPHLIAECLARPIILEKKIKNLYAFDEKFHGELKQRVQKEVSKILSPEMMKRTSGMYSETGLIKADKGIKQHEIKGQGMVLKEEEWNQSISKLIQDFNNESQKFSYSKEDAAIKLDAVPIGKISTLREDEDSFYLVALLDRAPDRIRTASVFWRKDSFGKWWEAVKSRFPAQIIEPEHEYVLPEIILATCGTEEWIATATTSAPQARDLHTAVWSGSEMIIWGGYTGAVALNTGGRYNPATNSWTAVTTSGAPTARYFHTAVWSGMQMIIWGGTSSATGEVNDGSGYSPSTDSWSAISTTGAPEARRQHTAVWNGTYMIVWGGQNPGGSGILDSGGRYSWSTNLWSAVSTTGAPTARFYHSAVWSGSGMIIWGGYDNITNFDTGGIYNVSTNTWTAISTTGAPEGRRLHTAKVIESEMIVWGGRTASGATNTGGKYNFSTNTWVATTTTNAPTARYDHTAVLAGTEMVIWGGANGTNYYNTGGRYFPSGDYWISTPTTAAPTARSSQTAVWTGSEMIVWGGWDSGGNVLNTGGRYATGSAFWEPTSLINVPAGRSYQGGVWTGTEMIIWGGWDFSNYYNTGGRYNPATDSWTATSTVNAPQARDSFGWVWTGTEMIVWGGWNNSVLLNTGGRYNPSTNTWTATNTTGAPTARDYHTAVWSGTQMIVWGGNDGSFTNTGARYTPSSNSWTATTTTGAPMERMFHTAVWTGTEMIVWGGSGTSGFYNTGGRYNPGTNSWTATAIPGALAGRTEHTAIWTGTEMIMWGGSAPAAVNTGGRYNPGTNSWTQTTTTGAPAPRGSHSAVWTGSQMIVWGGVDAVDFMLTGSSYDLVANAWLSTALSGAPSKRAYHTAVWTGSNMIIWGGYSALNTGGVYCPGPCNPPVFGGVQSVADVNACQSGIRVNWQQPTNWGYGALSGTYDIRRYTTSGCSGSYVTVANDLSSVTTTYVDTTGTAATTYYYRVVATNDCTPMQSSNGTNACSAAIVDTVDTTPCLNVGNTLDVAKSGTNASISWTAVTCSDLANYRVYGSTAYSTPFPSGWTVLGNPAGTTFTNPLNSTYIAYKTLSVDSCGNVSSN